MKSPRLAPRVGDRQLQDTLQRMLDDLYLLNTMAGKYETRKMRMTSGKPEDISLGANLLGAFPIMQTTTLDETVVIVKADGSLRVTATFEGAAQDVTWLVVRV